MLMPDPRMLELWGWAPWLLGLVLMLPLGMFIGASIISPPEKDDFPIWCFLLCVSACLFALGTWLVG